MYEAARASRNASASMIAQSFRPCIVAISRRNTPNRLPHQTHHREPLSFLSAPPPHIVPLEGFIICARSLRHLRPSSIDQSPVLPRGCLSPSASVDGRRRGQACAQSGTPLPQRSA